MNEQADVAMPTEIAVVAITMNTLDGKMSVQIAPGFDPIILMADAIKNIRMVEQESKKSPIIRASGHVPRV